MRSYSLVWIFSLLLAVAACGDDSSSSSGEITSQEDVEQLFQTIMPDLVAALTDLANDLSFASSTVDKQNGSSTVQCPGGGSLSVNLNSGQATLTDCSAGGVTISASLFLFVSGSGGFYNANFSGTLMVSGTFTGTVEVISAIISWMDPATAANTFWDITVMVGERTFTVSGGGESLDCPSYTPLTPEPGNGPCDDDSDCQSFSCRDPAENPGEGCTCRHPNGGDCPQVNGGGSVGFGGACDDNSDCAGGLPCIDCECI